MPVGSVQLLKMLNVTLAQDAMEIQKSLLFEIKFFYQDKHANVDCLCLIVSLLMGRNKIHWVCKIEYQNNIYSFHDCNT